jgi:uncharacterized protein (TIGR02145 family)
MSVLLSPWSKRSAAIGSILLLLAACSDDGDDFVTPEDGRGSSEYDDSANTLRDTRDGQRYKTVQIGDQVWMAENLNYDMEGSVCREFEVFTMYGCFYDWNAAMKACPRGWRLPSEDDWTTLVDYAGGTKVAGGKLKATTAWDEKGGYSAGTDDYGFTALPGGVALDRSETRGEGRLSIINSGAFFWSSTEIDDDEAFTLNLRYENDTTGWFENRKNTLISVRCIKD